MEQITINSHNLLFSQITYKLLFQLFIHMNNFQVIYFKNYVLRGELWLK